MALGGKGGGVWVALHGVWRSQLNIREMYIASRSYENLEIYG